MARMSFYELMDALDKVCLRYQDIDFRDLDVRLVTGFKLELIVIAKKDTDKIIHIISLTDAPMGGGIDD